MQQEVNVAFILGRKAFFQHDFPPPPRMRVDAPVGTPSSAACLEPVLLLLGAGSLNGSANEVVPFPQLFAACMHTQVFDTNFISSSQMHYIIELLPFWNDTCIFYK